MPLEPGSPAQEEGTPNFIALTMEDVLSCYAEALGCSHQAARDQLRSSEALEAALARPLAYAFYEGVNVPYQAAVLAHGLVESHPFVDGNKRTALVALRIFVRLHGYRLAAPTRELAAQIIRLTRDELDSRKIGELDEWLQANLSPLK